MPPYCKYVFSLYRYTYHKVLCVLAAFYMGTRMLADDTHNICILFPEQFKISNLKEIKSKEIKSGVFSDREGVTRGLPSLYTRLSLHFSSLRITYLYACILYTI